MSKEESGSKDQLVVRMAGAFLPTVVTAHLLSIWLPKPLAWAVSVLGWNLAIYWMPPKPEMSFRRWLVIVVVLTLATLVLLILWPNMF